MKTQKEENRKLLIKKKRKKKEADGVDDLVVISANFCESKSNYSTSKPKDGHFSPRTKRVLET